MPNQETSQPSPSHRILERQVGIPQDAPPATRPSEEKLWERVQRERAEKQFDDKVQDRAQQFKEVFKGMDMDGDGRLTYQEFHRGLGKLGLHLPESEVRAIWGSNDSNGNHGSNNNNENVDPQPQWPAMENSVERNQVRLLNHLDGCL